MKDFKDHFSDHSEIYHKYRPIYPNELYKYLKAPTIDHELAWDCGTGKTNTILNSILNTGTINNIQNDSLKHLLTRWNDIYYDYEEDQTAHWNFVINQLRPLEGALIPTNYRGPWENIQFYQKLNSLEDVNAAKVKAYENLQYQNLLIWNHWWVAQQVTEGNDLEDTMNHIIELLEQEIALKSKK